MLERLIGAWRLKGKTHPQNLRHTITAILSRHQNGANWRSIPSDLCPWARAVQPVIRWARLGIWARLLRLAQHTVVQLRMTFLEGTNMRLHQKAAGARRKGGLGCERTSVRRWAARVVASAQRPV